MILPSERARSLSPTKSSSNAGTPNSVHSSLNISMHDDGNISPLDFQQPATSSDARVEGDFRSSRAPLKPNVLENSGFSGNLPQPALTPPTHSNVLSSASTIPKRAGTLSWQQRPSSRGFTGARSRPLSMVGAEMKVAESPLVNVNPTSTKESSLSRNKITQSLGSKDPAWFRQTEERGIGSAAFRRNREEDRPNNTSLSGRMPLPGLSKESSLEPEKLLTLPSESLRSVSPSTGKSVHRESGGLHGYSSSASASSQGGIRSPLPTLNSQRFQPPSSDAGSTYSEETLAAARTLAMSPSQGRISVERLDRSPSPTKGLGGFVQSAMLKRSDSVNKRWSAQAAPRLSRDNSIASTRNGYDGSRQTIDGMNPTKEFRPASPNRESSPLSISRPGSSHNTVTVTQSRTETDRSHMGISVETKKSETDIDNEFVKPALPHLKSSPTTESQKSKFGDISDTSTPSSPSKKWSPTKASWLENAIKKPDSPKPKIFPPQQPSWMTDINKAKQQRASVDLGRSEAFKEVTDEGLGRPTPPKIPTISQSAKLPPKGLGATNVAAPKSKVANNGTLEREPPLELKVKNEQEALGRTPSQEMTDEEKVNVEKKVISALKPKPSVPSTSSIESLHVRAHLGSPSTPKPKPRTPPKLDFRSTLKPRRVSNGKECKEEAEFKNVFGKLKRTQTQNYVAPDELKDNILRGKAGLAMTGGPQKTKRKDEFKESILKQKEAIKVGASPGIPRKPRGISPPGDQDLPKPEAITKRIGLAKSESSGGAILSNREEWKSSATPEPITELKSVRNMQPPEVCQKQPSTLTSTQKGPSGNGKPGDKFSSSLAGLLSKGPSPTANIAKPSVSMNPSVLANDASMSSLGKEDSASAPQLTHITKTRARGPKRRLPAAGRPISVTPPIAPASGLIMVAHVASQKLATTNASQLSPPAGSESETRPLANISNNHSKSSQPLLPGKPSTGILLLEKVKTISPKANSPTKENALSQAKPSPVVNQKPSLYPTDPPVRKPLIPSTSSPTNPPQKPLHIGELIRKVPDTAAHQNQHQESEDKGTSFTSVKGAIAVWGKSPFSDSPQPTRPRSPVKLPTRKDEQSALEIAGLTPVRAKEEPIGLGIQTALKESQISAPLDRNLPSPPMRSPVSPRSPPLPGKKPASIASRVPSSTLPSQPIERKSRTQRHEALDASHILSSFMGEAIGSTPKITIDAQSVLASRASIDGSDKIKTLRKQMWEVAGDAKLSPVPPHQEHILFEENLYVCTHVFGTLEGTRTTEVYFWYGDGVSQSTAEDAQLFARKIAKENSGKLIIVQQGQETSNFFQALGGIVITRRGSGSCADSSSNASATYMLCGRRHVGQIAFDEVDFSAKSLCSGFPYIISARFGKLYLWKGHGSGADELGCARLIGMDLGLTGEIEEVDEGQEPDAFWESLPGGKAQDVAAAENGNVQHWHLKASCEKYATRLFSVDVEAPRPKSSSSGFMWGRRGSAPQEENTSLAAQIREIVPFTQKDLASGGFYMLDAFFELFM